MNCSLLCLSSFFFINDTGRYFKNTEYNNYYSMLHVIFYNIVPIFLFIHKHKKYKCLLYFVSLHNLKMIKINIQNNSTYKYKY